MARVIPLIVLVTLFFPVLAKADLVRGLENYLRIVKGAINIDDLPDEEAMEVIDIYKRLEGFGTSGEGCDPAIESKIDGDFEGWQGDTIFKLRNGQIWQQISYAYRYKYAYSPDVLIFSSRGTCVLLVEDMDDTISVTRLK